MHIATDVDELYFVSGECGMCVCVVQELSAEKEQKSQLEMQLYRLSAAYADVKTQVQHGDYKIDNYDRVKTYVRQPVSSVYP